VALRDDARLVRRAFDRPTDEDDAVLEKAARDAGLHVRVPFGMDATPRYGV
jgi:hypothetical protein